MAAVVKSTVPAIVIESTIYFKNQGPAIARPFEATIRALELIKSFFVSGLFMIPSKYFLISDFDAVLSSLKPKYGFLSKLSYHALSFSFSELSPFDITVLSSFAEAIAD